MSNRTGVMKKKRPPEAEKLDELILQEEIEHTLRGLDKAYIKYMSIFDNACEVNDNAEKTNVKKGKIR